MGLEGLGLGIGICCLGMKEIPIPKSSKRPSYLVRASRVFASLGQTVLSNLYLKRSAFCVGCMHVQGDLEFRGFFRLESSKSPEAAYDSVVKGLWMFDHM